MASMNLTEDDKGKRVVNSNGQEIGMVSEVRHGAAYVDPDPELTDTIRSKLGWTDVDQEDFSLQSDRIATVTDDEIRLKGSI